MQGSKRFIYQGLSGAVHCVGSVGVYLVQETYVSYQVHISETRHRCASPVCGSTAFGGQPSGSSTHVTHRVSPVVASPIIDGDN